jgi:hypothetical protein
MRSPESTSGRLLSLLLVGSLGITCLSACGGESEEGNSSPTTAATTRRGGSTPDPNKKACHIEITAAPGGYDAKAIVDGGSFPGGTTFTGHGKYRASIKDGWDSHTPPESRIPMGQAVHFASPIIHNDNSMKLESVSGVLDPGGGKVRTFCGVASPS